MPRTSMHSKTESFLKIIGVHERVSIHLNPFSRRKKVKSSPVADAEVIDMLKDVNLDSRNRPLGGKMSSRKGKSDSKPGSEKSGRNPTGNPSSSEVIGFSTVRVIERKRKTVLCQRHIPQIVLRGEHVACVIPVAASWPQQHLFETDKKCLEDAKVIAN